MLREWELTHVMSPTVSPEVTVLSRSQVNLGEPNILICFIDKFSPPAVNVTWRRNGVPVTKGVSETVFLPRDDHLFRKFHYLTFVPSTEDYYDCEVNHWGLEEPLVKHWGKASCSDAGVRILSAHSMMGTQLGSRAPASHVWGLKFSSQRHKLTEFRVFNTDRDLYISVLSQPGSSTFEKKHMRVGVLPACVPVNDASA